MLRSLRTALVGIAAVAIAGGCSVLEPRPDPTRYYVLTPVVEPSAQGRIVNVRLSLGPVALPGYLDRPAIAVRRAPHRLEIEEYERWAEPLPAAFSRVLEQNLVALLGNDVISNFPSSTPTQGITEYVLGVDVLRFEHTGEGQAELAARWWLKDARTRAAVVSRESTARRTVTGPDTAAAVEALSQCAADLSRDIAQAITLRERAR